MEDLSSKEWRIIWDALGVAMVASLSDDGIPCDFDNEEYEDLHEKLVDLGLVGGTND